MKHEKRRQLVRDTYEGVLRCRVSVLAMDKVKLEWFEEETREVIWTETIRMPQDGMSGISQINCSGSFDTRSGYFMDEFGLKHHRMTAEPGKMVSK